MTDERYMYARAGQSSGIMLAECRDGVLISVEEATTRGSELLSKAKAISAAEAKARRRATEADLEPDSVEGKRFVDRVMSHELGIAPRIERGDHAWVQDPDDPNCWLEATVLRRNGLHNMWVVSLWRSEDEEVHVMEEDIKPPCLNCGGPGLGCCSLSAAQEVTDTLVEHRVIGTEGRPEGV